MISLNLPAPLSVNYTRRINWAAKPKMDKWVAQADILVLLQGRLPEAVTGPFEITITLPETNRLDADNTPKMVIDYLRRLRLIENDNPKHMRRVVIEFGDAPEGVRVTVKGMEEQAT